MNKTRISAILLLLAGLLIGAFVFYSQKPDTMVSGFPFKLGLDLNGGTHLVYQADVSKIAGADIDGSMETLRNVIESRINAFGVAEPLVQTEKSSSNGQTLYKLVVEIPGVTDVSQAVKLIGDTPILEFKTEKPASLTPVSTVVKANTTPPPMSTNINATVPASTSASASVTEAYAATEYQDTQLTGRYLQSADLEFDQNGQPVVGLVFNDEGKQLFSQLTGANVGKTIAIFLDGVAISKPVVQGQISDGKAIITGRFTPEEARSLARSLKYGALPVPIDLVGTQSIGAGLGADALHASVNAGMWGFIIVAIFLFIWYRLPGIVAILSLGVYTVVMLAIFKIFGVVLTSAGLAGFIISIGMAVDGNILIFERMKEELAKGYNLEDGIREGFARAWLSIRDSNISSIITAVILFSTATSSLIKGFALVFGIGVLVSMFTSITVSRTLLLSLGVKSYSGIRKFLFGNGFSLKKSDTIAGVEVRHK